MNHSVALFRAGLSAAVILAVATFNAKGADDAAEKDRDRLQVPEGFEVKLFASDPEIRKPVQINFDARGRMWIVSSPSYPQLSPADEPSDKVILLEDTDNDGRADKQTVFADGLLMPTGIEFGDSGVYVGQSTEVLHLSDTDGDGRADRKRVVLSGFGTEDTHHMLHTFRWGPGGQLHFGQSIYIHSHVETPRGVRRLNGGGFWAFRPDSMRLKVFVHGMVNSWGIAFDGYGQSFGVDNESNESVKYFLPGARLRYTPGESHILGGIVKGKPKLCGAEIVSGRHYPDDWQGDLITCDFRAHRVCRFKLTDDGAGFAATELDPLVSTTNIAFRPIDVKLGPDGAIYICDWYNPIINHGEVDFRDPRRDKTHGRIWRVVAKNRKLAPRPHLTNATIDDLLDAQTSPEGWTRHFARRVLAERPRREVLPKLKSWLGGQADDQIRLRGLWVYQTLDIPAPALLEELLNSSNPRVRAAAVRVLNHWLDRDLQGSVQQLAARINDKHPRVRLEAIRALAEIPQPQSMEIALRALTQPMDRFLDYALKLNARETLKVWLPSLDVQHTKHPQRWIFALLAVDSPSIAEPLLQLWKSGKVPADDVAAVTNKIARFGNAEELRAILNELQQRVADAKISVAEQSQLIDSLQNAFRSRRVKPAGDLSVPLRTVLKSKQTQIGQAAIRLAALWKIESLRAEIETLATSKTTPAPQRETAIEAQAGYGGEASLKFLTQLAENATDTRIRLKAIAVLAQIDSKRAATLAKPILLSAKSAPEARELFAAFLKIQSGPGALVAALKDETLAQAVAEEGVRLINASGRLQPNLLATFRKAGGLPTTDRSISKQQLQQLVAAVQKSGNAQRGEKIYRREKMACIKCHTIKGSGGKVGPDLTTIGTSAPTDYLIESLLLPNKAVKENFHAMTVETSAGKLLSGVLVSKSKKEIVLRTAEDKLITIPGGDVEETVQAASLMPLGLVDELTAAELTDLVRFLSELGKPGPYGPSRELIARKWHLRGPYTASAAQPVTKELALGRIKTDDGSWRPSLTTFDGWVYLREFALKPEVPILFGTTTIVVQNPGKFRLALEPTSKAGIVRLDGDLLKPTQQTGREQLFDVQLSKGAHRLLVRIDLTSTPRFLKLRAYPLDEKAKLELAGDKGDVSK